jgi:hypothetical protein
MRMAFSFSPGLERVLMPGKLQTGFETLSLKEKTTPGAGKCQPGVEAVRLEVARSTIAATSK